MYKPWYRKKRYMLVLAALVGGLWLLLQTPANDGPWREDQVRTAWVEFVGRQFTVHNIRDFRYDEKLRAVSGDYRDEHYDLDDLAGTWFGLSHFGPLGLAHAFVSFEFDAGDEPRYLVVSVEARLRPKQIYNPLAGLFRAYTKISVFATEEDAIGLRSHLSGQRVMLYPVVGGEGDLEEFFLALVEDANELNAAPEFYNTIIDNCLTSLLRHTALVENLDFGDLRVLLPGHMDRLTYAFDITPADLPFDEARERATIDPTLRAIGDPSF